MPLPRVMMVVMGMELVLHPLSSFCSFLLAASCCPRWQQFKFPPATTTIAALVCTSHIVHVLRDCASHRHDRPSVACSRLHTSTKRRFHQSRDLRIQSVGSVECSVLVDRKPMSA